MARVNVDQKALTDPRFYRLGLELGAESQHAQAVGLFAMIRVWNECIERGQYSLDGWILQAILGAQKAAEHICNSDLAKQCGDNRFRIKGTKGRTEYLKVLRSNGSQYGHLGAKHGRKGGRPKKPPQEGLENPQNGLAENPPPAPAPAPAPAPVQKQEEEKTKRAVRPPFVAPTVEEVRAYVATREVKIDPDRFVDHYTANGWVQGRGKPVVDWKSCVRTWEKNNFNGPARATETPAERVARVRREMEGGSK